MRVNGPLTRSCPRCSVEIVYKTPSARYEAEKRGSLCMNCGHLPSYKKAIFIPGKKICNKCRIEKDVDAFNKDASETDGSAVLCRDCAKEKDRQWAKNNPDKVHARSVLMYQRHSEKIKKDSKKYRDENPGLIRLNNLKRYDLSSEQLDYVLGWENGNCAACGFPLAAIGTEVGNGVIDHDHSGNKFRAILCRYCNHTIGHARENPETLRKCADYLEKWKENENWLDFATPEVLKAIHVPEKIGEEK